MPLTAYLDRQIDRRDESGKQPQRDRVGSYLLSNHPQRPLRLLSFPCVYWAFERQIEAAHSHPCTFIGVERESGIIHRSEPWMPGKNTYWFSDKARKFAVQGIRSDRARMLCTDFATFCRLCRGDMGKRRKRIEWRAKYRNWTAIWLDFTSQISPQIEVSLPTLGCWCHMDYPAVPVAVTVMKGREKRAIGEKLFALWTDRAGYIAALLDSNKFRRFETDEVFEHVSSEATMLTVCGRLIERQGSAA